MSEEISTEKKTSNTLVTIVMVVVGVILVLLVGVLVGKALTPAPEGPPVNLPPPPSFSGPYAVAGAAINVRSGPGTEFPSYGVAPAGSSAPIVAVTPDGGWWQISVPTTISPDGQAWVSADYVNAYNADGVPLGYPQPELYSE
jgi:hypothetical protein